jgi:hypothetical protein
MCINWPDHLINDLKHKRTIVFYGSGVSAHAKTQETKKSLPTWENLLKAGLEKIGRTGVKHINQAIKAKDYLLACELLKRRLGADWEIFLEEKLGDHAYQPSKIHELIFRLDQRLVFTTTVNRVYNAYIAREAKNTILIKKFNDVDAYSFLRKADMFLLKLHGCISAPDHLIFTQTDYASARTQHSAFYEAIAAAFLSHTILFLGCGLNDPDVRLILENYRFGFKGLPAHYFISPKTHHDHEIQAYQESRNIKILQYNPRENHKFLIESLETLNTLIEAP